jgi:hypothetical protein
MEKIGRLFSSDDSVPACGSSRSLVGTCAAARPRLPSPGNNGQSLRRKNWSGGSRLLFGLAACLGLSGGLAFPSTVNSMAQPGIEATAGLIAMLQARSPGERGDATATSKPRQARVAAAAQAGAGVGDGEPNKSSRAAALLPGMMTPQSPIDLDSGAALLPLGSVPDQLAAPFATSSPSGISGSEFGQAGPGIVFAAPSVGGGGAGGIGGPGNGGVTSPPGSADVPVVAISAVPEPSTWITMLLGFGAIGLALRRRRAPGASDDAKLSLAGGGRGAGVSPRACGDRLPA